MKGINRRIYKRFAGFLAFCLTVTSCNMVSWADVQSAFRSSRAVFFIEGSQLRDSVLAAPREGQAVHGESLGFSEEDKSLKKDYGKLFGGDGVYEISPSFDMEGDAEDVELRLFVKAESVDGENSSLTGEEQIIFLYINHSENTVAFRSNIDGYMTQKVSVKGNAISEAEFSQEDTGADAEGETDPMAPEKSEPVISEKNQDETEKETQEETRDETQEETQEGIPEETQENRQETVEQGTTGQEAPAADTVNQETGVSGGGSRETSEGKDGGKEELKAPAGISEQSQQLSISRHGLPVLAAAVDREEDPGRKEAAVGTTRGKAYGQILLDGVSYAKAYTATLSQLKADASEEGLAVTYAVEPAGTAYIKGPDQVEPGKDLVFTVIPQSGYVIDSVTSNGETLDAAEDEAGGPGRYTILEVEEEQEVTVVLAETGDHPEFKVTKLLGDVTVSLHAEEGILPAGTEARITEVTEKVEGAVMEKLSEEEETNSSKEILAYDIELFCEGEKLDNSWSRNGYVEVKFSGRAIEEKSRDSQSVEIMHVDTDRNMADKAVKTIGTNDIKAVNQVAAPVDLGEDGVGEIGFEAEHFSLYILRFDVNYYGYDRIEVVDQDGRELGGGFTYLDNAIPASGIDVKTLSKKYIDMPQDYAFLKAAISDVNEKGERSEEEIDSLRYQDGFVEYREAGGSDYHRTIDFGITSVLRFYYSHDEAYTVNVYIQKQGEYGNKPIEIIRTAKAGDHVSVSPSDTEILKLLNSYVSKYVFDEKNTGNRLEAPLSGTGDTELSVYYKELFNVIYLPQDIVDLDKFDFTVYSDLEYGSPMPKYAGSTAPEDVITENPDKYEFVGWTTKPEGVLYPELPEVVTCSVSYRSTYELKKEVYHKVEIRLLNDDDPSGSVLQTAELPSVKEGTDPAWEAGFYDNLPLNLKSGDVNFVMVKDPSGNPLAVKSYGQEGVKSDQETVTLYYSRDMEGAEAGGDGIPDKYQVVFTYEAGNHGSVSGTVKETVTRDLVDGQYSQLSSAAPSPDVETVPVNGYRLSNWSASSAGLVDGVPVSIFDNIQDAKQALFKNDTTFTAKFSGKSGTDYQVEFYFESQGVYPEVTMNVETRKGTVGEEVRLADEDKTKEGYIYDKDAGNLELGIVKADGSLALKVYLKQQFTVVYDPGQQPLFQRYLVTGLSYGDKTPSFSVPENEEYKFTGWNTAVADTVKADGEYIAQWKKSSSGDNGGGNSGGGNSGGGSTGQNPGNSPGSATGSPADGLVTIDPEEVPLAGLPGGVSDVLNYLVIDDGGVPLAALPKTGDRAQGFGLAAAFSGLLLAAYAVLGKRRKEE